MAQVMLAALPAAIGAWVMAANMISKDATSIILPGPLQALVDAVFGARSRRRQALRRRLVGHLVPLTLEREWLFGALPPAVTANVLGRLDAVSRKALRATCRRTRLCVDGTTTRLLLDGRGLRRFAVAPLSVLFPQLRELRLTGTVAAGPTAGGGPPWGVGAAGLGGGAGRGGGVAGPAQLLALLDSGALAGLPALDLLDLSGWRRPSCCFTRRDWQALATALHTRAGAAAATSAKAATSSTSSPGTFASALVRGAGVSALSHLVLRLDWRVLPLSSVWPPPEQLPSWQEAAWAVRWMARKAPQVRLELEGPPLPLPSPATLQAFHAGGLAVRRLPVQVVAVPAWAIRRFDTLGSLQGLRQLTLRLPDDMEPRAAMTALQEVRALEQLALPNSTLADADMQLLARLRALRTLLVGGLVLQGVETGLQGAPGSPVRPGLERLVVSCRLEVAPSLGLLAALPALAALGVCVDAMSGPVHLLPQLPPPQPLQPVPPPQQPLQHQQPQGLLQELLQHQLAQLAGPGAVAPAAAPPPLPDVWAAPPPPRPLGLGHHPHRNDPLQQPAVAAAAASRAPPPPSTPPPVNLRELCLMYGKQPPSTAVAFAPAGGAAVPLDRLAAQLMGAGPGGAAPAAAEGPEAQGPAAAADLALQAAGLPTLQRLRLWRCPSPGRTLQLLKPVAERLQLPLVLLELNDMGPPEADRPAPPVPPPAAGNDEGDGDLSEEEAEEGSDDEGEGLDSEEPHDLAAAPAAEAGPLPPAAPAAAAAAAVGGASGGFPRAGGGLADAAGCRGEMCGGSEPALLTSLLTSRPWRTSSDQLAALLLGCCRTLAVSGGHPSLLRSLGRVGATATSGRGGGGSGRAAVALTTQRLMVRRHPGLDETLLRQLMGGLSGLQVLGVAGCCRLGLPEMMRARREVGTRVLALGWASET